MSLRLAALLATSLVTNAFAQTPPSTTAGANYETIQASRDTARKLIKDGKGAEASLRNAAQVLEASLQLLDQRPVFDLAVGSYSLYARGHDVRLDLAEIYAKLGQKEQALSLLEAAQSIVWLPRLPDFISNYPALKALQAEPRYAAVMARAAVPARFWNKSALATPYQEQLSVAERTAGLSLIWSTARDNFVHFDHVPNLDWNQLYLDYLPQVMAAPDTASYYKLLQRFMAQLQDGHSNVFLPKALQDELDRPPLRTALIEGKVVVETISSPSLRARIAIGDEILRIDGQPVHSYAQQYVEPYVSSSTEQDKRLRTYTYTLLQGKASQAVNLEIRSKDGRLHTESVARSGYTDVENPAKFEFKQLAGGISYFSLDHFESDAGVKAFEAALPAILASKGLVLDLRRNGGGSSNFGLEILGYLSSAPIPLPRSFVRADNAFSRTRSDSMTWSPLNAPNSSADFKQSSLFSGPVTVLLGPRSFSAAEDFLVSFLALKRGALIGEASGGSTGQPAFFKLPGGGSARLCVKRDTYPDGSAFVGQGISPTITVLPTVEALRAGRDLVLERALAHLQEQH